MFFLFNWKLLRGPLNTECGLLVQQMTKAKHRVNKNNLITTGIIENWRQILRFLIKNAKIWGQTSQ